MRQLILGTGTTIWWVTEPNSFNQFCGKMLYVITQPFTEKFFPKHLSSNETAHFKTRKQLFGYQH
jgi:hypothetical protein